MSGSWRVQSKHKVTWMWQPTSGRFLAKLEAQRKLNLLQAEDTTGQMEFRIIYDDREPTHRFGILDTKPRPR